jgi:hypothetical protein
LPNAFLLKGVVVVVRISVVVVRISVVVVRISVVVVVRSRARRKVYSGDGGGGAPRDPPPKLKVQIRTLTSKETHIFDDAFLFGL